MCAHPHAAHARARVCLGAHVSTPNMRALSVGVARLWSGEQVFSGAAAFNANIGAWNTASVTTLYDVCAAFRPADALGRSSMRRGRCARLHRRFACVRFCLYRYIDNIIGWGYISVCNCGCSCIAFCCCRRGHTLKAIDVTHTL